MKSDKKAFTLMEVLVCCTLLTSVIGLSAGLLLSASKYLQQSRTHLLRNYVAEQLMEDIVEAGYHRVEDLPTTGALEMESKLRGKSKNIIFNYRISVVQDSESLKSVQLVIGQDSEKESSYETLLTDYL